MALRSQPPLGDASEAAATHVDTACPLDCPDACSLTVSVHKGKVVEIDGSQRNPVTGGFICAKVRRFGDRVYGPDRLQHPAVRKGRKGEGQFKRVSWEEALGLIAERLQAEREAHGGASILPFSYGGSNGLLTQDNLDAVLWRRIGASRLQRTVCAAPTGAANAALYGKMPSVTYQDYPEARLIILWGVNPQVSGIHLMPYIKEAQSRGARVVVVDPRAIPLARGADLHLAPRPGTDLVIALAMHRHLFGAGLADATFLASHTRGADELRDRADEWTFERAAEVSGVSADAIRQLAEWYGETSPALINCGWGLERNRNGGHAAAAVLALPAVGGKFGVRGGGFAMSNSSSWGIERTWVTTPEPPTRQVNMNHLGRVLTTAVDPPVNLLFVYNCNPVATMPHQRLVMQGLEREDLFTVVFDQVMTDTAMYADVVLPNTTFLEGYDFAKAYGPIHLDLVRPVIDVVGESRSNADVFGDLCRRLGVLEEGEATGELDLLVQIMGALPGRIGEDLGTGVNPAPAFGTAPVQFVDVFPGTPDRKADLFPAALDAVATHGLYRYEPDPGSAAYPLALISPSSERTISSTLGELGGPEPRFAMNPEDAEARGLAEGDGVRVFNELGEVHGTLTVSPLMRPGVVSLPKGIWRRTMRNGLTSNALSPDTITDIGAGACFNDARVQVASLPSA